MPKITLEAPPAYEISSAASSPILTIYLQKMTLPQGAFEVLVEDQVIRNVRIDPTGKDGAKVVFFLYQPTRWKVFALKPETDKPDHRLVIDVFRPPGEIREKVEKPESRPPVMEKVEKPASKPSGPQPQKEKEPPAKVESAVVKGPAPATPEPRVPSPKVEEPPRAIAPEEPRGKGRSPPKALFKTENELGRAMQENLSLKEECSTGFRLRLCSSDLLTAKSLRGVGSTSRRPRS